jgi:Na+/H+-translocating membrane pyrophosphatase
MHASDTTESTALTMSGTAGVVAGLGVVTFALFPLAIPFLLLTAVFAAPLALIGLAAAIPLGIVAIAVVAIRRLARRSRPHRAVEHRRQHGLPPAASARSGS